MTTDHSVSNHAMLVVAEVISLNLSTDERQVIHKGQEGIIIRQIKLLAFLTDL